MLHVACEQTDTHTRVNLNYRTTPFQVSGYSFFSLLECGPKKFVFFSRKNWFITSFVFPDCLYITGFFILSIFKSSPFQACWYLNWTFYASQELSYIFHITDPQYLSSLFYKSDIYESGRDIRKAAINTRLDAYNGPHVSVKCVPSIATVEITWLWIVCGCHCQL